jgi:hypothetical protein
LETKAGQEGWSWASTFIAEGKAIMSNIDKHTTTEFACSFATAALNNKTLSNFRKEPTVNQTRGRMQPP